MAIFSAIVNFFCLIWTSFVGLFISQEKTVDLSEDIESGVSISATRKETGNVLDISRDKAFLLPPSDGFGDNVTGTINYDHPSRRPSRRASAVDPVKSRIVEATLKQVQDKTIGVVKTAIILPPATVIPQACSAVIEYYDPRIEDPTVLFGTTKRRPKPEAHTVQRDLPPIVVEDVSTPSEENHINTRKSFESTSTSESFSDLFDQFPMPPTHIPKPPPAVIRPLNEHTRLTSAAPVKPWASPLMAVDESGDCSETGSSASTYSSELTSDGTADTSLPGSPASVNNAVMPTHCPSQNHLPVVENSLPGPTTRTFDINGPSKYESASQATPNDVAVLAARVIDEPGNDLLPTLNTKGLVERSHNVVDGFKRADLQKGDIFNEACLKSRAAQISCTAIQDMLRTSPSEDVVVDSLLAQLETSFELDQSEPSSLIQRDSHSRGVCTDIRPELRSVAPLKIVKKNKVQRDEVQPDKDLDAITAKWEESTEQGRKAFREAEADDTIFHDLFCRDSSFFSQSSLAVGSGNPLGNSSVASLGTSSIHAPDQLDHSFQSFESAEQSIDELLSTLNLFPDEDTVIEVKEPTIVESSLYIAPATKDVAPNAVKPKADLSHNLSLDEQIENSDDLYPWMSRPCDGDQEGVEPEEEGEDDQWSDHFELTLYAA